MANVNIIMDGRSLTVPAGTSVLEAARENGIRIPTLCFLKELDPRATRISHVQTAPVAIAQCPA